MSSWQIWLVAAVILAAVEMVTTGFFILSFAGGSLAAAVAAWLGVSGVFQVLIFLLVSAGLFVTTRYWVSPFEKESGIQTNAEGLVGLVGIVESLEQSGILWVRVSGELWRATSHQAKDIRPGEQVRINKVEGVTLIVSPI